MGVRGRELLAAGESGMKLLAIKSRDGGSGKLLREPEGEVVFESRALGVCSEDCEGARVDEVLLRFRG